MRWIWIDSFVEFESGKRAVAVKNVTLAEDYLHDHFPGFPVMPATLLIEGMAQTAGILVGEARGFTENVILAKIRRAEFSGWAGPGDQIRYEAAIESIDERAAMTSGMITKSPSQNPLTQPSPPLGEMGFGVGPKNWLPLGRVDLIFSHVDQAEKTLDLPDHNFVFTEQFMNLLAGFRNTGQNPGRQHWNGGKTED